MRAVRATAVASAVLIALLQRREEDTKEKEGGLELETDRHAECRMQISTRDSRQRWMEREEDSKQNGSGRARKASRPPSPSPSSYTYFITTKPQSFAPYFPIFTLAKTKTLARVSASFWG
jgi:hypothetical protein